MSTKTKGIIAGVGIVVIVLLVIFGFIELINGNRQIFDTAMRFDHAMVKLTDGEIVEGRVDSWMDFENSDQIQVTINGTTYLTHCMNVTLIKN